MAIKCGHCRGVDIVYGFDTYQCLECGGHSKMSDGSATVPTSAIDPPGATYSGPGAHLIADPDNPPFPAKEAIR